MIQHYSPLIQFLWILSIFFLFLALVLFLSIVISKKRKQIIQIKTQRISALSLAYLERQNTLIDTSDTSSVLKKKDKNFENSILTDAFSRKIFLKQLIEFKVQHAEQAEVCKRIYSSFGFDKHSYTKTKSKIYFIAIQGLRELSEMQHYQFLNKSAPKFIKSAQVLLRREAQIALIGSNGFNSLQLLNQLDKKLTDWQQISLFSVLKKHHLPSDFDITPLLESPNSDVQLFGIRIVHNYGLKNYFNAVLPFLKSADIRHKKRVIFLIDTYGLEAFEQLKELAISDSNLSLKSAILSALSKRPTAAVKQFLISFFNQPGLPNRLYFNNAKALHSTLNSNEFEALLDTELDENKKNILLQFHKL